MDAIIQPCDRIVSSGVGWHGAAMSNARIAITHIRLPVELKGRLQASADEGHRSLNAEILLRLQQSFNTTGTKQGEYHVDDLAARIASLEKLVRESGLVKSKKRRAR